MSQCVRTCLHAWVNELASDWLLICNWHFGRVHDSSSSSHSWLPYSEIQATVLNLLTDSVNSVDHSVQCISSPRLSVPASLSTRHFVTSNPRQPLSSCTPTPNATYVLRWVGYPAPCCHSDYCVDLPPPPLLGVTPDLDKTVFPRLVMRVFFFFWGVEGMPPAETTQQ